MKQYTVSLNQQAASVLDELEKTSSIPQSKLIKGIIDRFAEQFVKISFTRKIQEPRYTHFDKLAGFIKLKTKKKTNYSLTVDDIYLKD